MTIIVWSHPFSKPQVFLAQYIRHSVATVYFVMELLCILYCLLTISDVVIIDFDEEVSVRSTLFVPSTQCMEYLVHHNPLVLTAPTN